MQRRKEAQRPKKKRRLVTEESLTIGNIVLRVWRYDRKWYIGWDEADDSLVKYRGKKPQ